MNNHVLIVDSVHQTLIDNLASLNLICEVNQSMSYDDFLLSSKKYCGLIIRNRFPIDKKLIDAKSELKFIVRIGSGIEHIDSEYCSRKGIACISTPEGNAPAVAEHSLALTLAALKHLFSADKEVRQGEWLRNKNKSYQLSSATVGIIGYGNTGQAFAKLLRHFGSTILIYDKYNHGFPDDWIREVTLGELLQKSDIVSIHINYIPENHYFINKETFNLCKKGAIFINTSRGAVVNTADLIEALNNKKIRMAALDVLEFENSNLQIPPKNEWNNTLQTLSEMDNVILTPHIAGQTYDADKKHAEIAFKKIKAFLNL
jgi:D-3-phosphoglycerate dehydrogenase